MPGGGGGWRWRGGGIRRQRREGRERGGDEGKIGMLAVKVVKVKMNMEVVFEVCILR